MKFFKTRQKGYLDLFRSCYKKTHSGAISIKKEKVILKHQYRAVLKKELHKDIIEG